MQLLEEADAFLHRRERRAAAIGHVRDRLLRHGLAGAAQAVRRSARCARRWAIRTACDSGSVSCRSRLSMGRQARGQQRMTAEREEVVVDAQARQAQRLLHGRQDLAFELVARRHGGVAARGGDAGTGGGRALRSILPLGSSGSASSATKCCGSMYSGRKLARCWRSAVASGMAAARHHVGHDAHVARRVLARHHQRAVDGAVARQVGFDLAEFDAVAPHLDLVVGAAQAFEHAVGAPAAAGRRCGTSARRCRRGRARSARRVSSGRSR